MRPKTIAWFEYLSLASLLFNIPTPWMDWNLVLFQISPVLVAIVLIGLTAIVLALTLLVSRGRRRFAGWLLFLIYGAGLAFAVPYRGMMRDYHPFGWFILGQTMLEGLAMLLLLTPSARKWLRTKA